MDEYKKQMKKGGIREAYRGLMRCIMNVRMYLHNMYPGTIVLDHMYFG